MALSYLLRHCHAVRTAAAALGLQAHVDIDDMALVLALRQGPQRWFPRFLVSVGDSLAYTPVLTEQASGFAGWLPYAGRQWPEGSGKAAFKRHADACGMPTPAACTDPARIGGPFLVKRNDGSFGRGQRGPFAAWNPQDGEQRLAPDEYYENFIPGLIAKAWCWGGQCVALELQSPPVVTGDGQRSLRELAKAVAGGPAARDEKTLQWLASFHGLGSLDAIVPAGRQALAHYRYGTAAVGAATPSPNMLEPARASGLTAQFERAARQCEACITRAGHPAATLYTLDAVVDEGGTAWFLEMNCNPLVHPDAYAAMLASAPGSAASPTDATSESRSAALACN